MIFITYHNLGNTGNFWSYCCLVFRLDKAFRIYCSRSNLYLISYKYIFLILKINTTNIYFCCQ